MENLSIYLYDTMTEKYAKYVIEGWYLGDLEEEKNLCFPRPWNQDK